MKSANLFDGLMMLTEMRSPQSELALAICLTVDLFTHVGAQRQKGHRRVIPCHSCLMNSKKATVPFSVHRESNDCLGHEEPGLQLP